MYSFWTVMKLELYLIWRNRGIWLLILAMLFIGLLTATNNRNQPWGIWSQMIVAGIFLTLILIFSTGNQISRDQTRRVAGVIYSTPVKTSIYVLARYSAALLSLLALAGLCTLTAIVADQIYNVPQQVGVFLPVLYPSFGPQVYLTALLWLFLVPTIFGSTLMLALTTLTRGKRILAALAALLLWVLPMFTLPGNSQALFDISAVSFTGFDNTAANFWFDNLSHPLPFEQFVRTVMSLARATMPPEMLINDLLVNRMFFLSLALLLLLVTIVRTHYMRRQG